MKIFQILASAFLTFILWYLPQAQIIDTRSADFQKQESLEQLASVADNILAAHRGTIGGMSAILLAFLQLNVVVLAPRRLKQKLITRILNEIVTRVFDNRRGHHRITVFKRTTWAVAMMSYCYNNFLRHPWDLVKKNEFRRRCNGIPSFAEDHPIIYCRYGQPGETLRTTLFKVPDKEEDVDGIVSSVWFNSLPEKYTLPALDGIDFDSTESLQSLSGPDQKLVRKYMEEGHIRNFETLKRMNRRSQNFYASPILDADQEMWGVVIIESNDKKVKFSEPRIAKTVMYINFIEKIVNRQGGSV